MFDLEKVIELYHQYASMLLGVCIRYVADKSEAEDILQESFLKILRNIREYTGKGHFENWMKKIVVNTAITHFHREKKHYYHEEIESVSDTDLQYSLSPEKEFDAKELQQLISNMPEGYRMIFSMYAIEGFKHREIAEKLKIEESTSKTQYLRARNWIIREMKKLNWI